MHSLFKQIIIGLIFMAISILCSSQTLPANKVIIKKGNFSFKNSSPPKIQVQNNKLNISITNNTGDMLQINGIDINNLMNTTLTSAQFKTVLISLNKGTYTNLNDTNSASILEIKCANNKPGNLITLGVKSTVYKGGKSLRINATLSGIIPSYTYTNTNQN